VKKPPLYYGWVIVFVAICFSTIAYGIRNAFSVFFDPILNEFGWARGSTAIMLSLSLVVYAIMAPVIGSLADRWKPKRIIQLGVIILTLATASCAFANEVWHFYILFGILTPIGTACCGFPLLLPALTNWFIKRRGMMIGIGQSGGSLSFAYGFLVQAFILQVGWRDTFFVLAAIEFIVLLPLSFLYFYRPEDKGLSIQESAHKNVPAANVDQRVEERGLKTILRDYRLWLLVICMFFYWGVGNYLVLAHQIKYAIDMGFSSVFASSVFAIYGIFAVLGQLSGFISDLFGREKIIAFAVTLSTAGIISLLAATDISKGWLLYTYAIAFGYASGIFSPTIIARAADLFHGKHIGTVVGLLLTGMGLGGGVGPWLGGFIYDISGSYTSAFYMVIASYVVAVTLFFMASHRKGQPDIST
jgi:MFS family permease